LGATDSAAGESRRNENVQFNLIDNNGLKYLNIRLGNTFRRGGIRNMNAALARTWTAHSDWRTTLRVESINFFNTPQFASPSADLSSPAFGKITNTLNDGRSFQFTLEFRF
jgi:hypothetical protein